MKLYNKTNPGRPLILWMALTVRTMMAVAIATTTFAIVHVTSKDAIVLSLLAASCAAVQYAICGLTAALVERFSLYQGKKHTDPFFVQLIATCFCLIGHVVIWSLLWNQPPDDFVSISPAQVAAAFGICMFPGDIFTTVASYLNFRWSHLLLKKDEPFIRKWNYLKRKKDADGMRKLLEEHMAQCQSRNSWCGVDMFCPECPFGGLPVQSGRYGMSS